MEIKEAHYILAIAKYKNISKAAAALYISQPSLSKYLHNLENRLGTPLFDHINKQYIPTYTGERYLHYARQTVLVHNDWLTELQDLKNHKKGRLNIAVPIVLSACLIPKTLGKFHKNYPEIEINIYETASSIEKLFEKQTDLDAIIYNASTLPKHLDYRILGKSEITMVVPKGHPLTKLAVQKKGFKYPWLDIQTAKNEEFILLHDDLTTRKLLNCFFKENDFTPKAWMKTRSTEVAIRAVAHNNGLTFANENYVKNTIISDKLSCLSIGKSPLESTMIAAFRPNQYLSEHLKHYLDEIQAFCFTENNIQ